MGPSFYARYLEERTDDKIIETDKGYATYRFLNDGKSVYIIDIFILPDFRRVGEASNLADQVAEIARSKGATEMLGTINPSAKNSTDSMSVLVAYGMKLRSSADNVIILGKDI